MSGASRLKVNLLAHALIVCLSAAGALSPRSAWSKDENAHFLDFPQAFSLVGARKADAFAWIVQQGETSSILFARAPLFKPVRLFSKTDADGQPITALKISPDARFIVFQTGEREWAERAYNPASLIPAATLSLWAIDTTSAAQPIKIGPGWLPQFSPTNSRLIYRHGEDLLSQDLPGGDTLQVPGVGKIANGEWSPDGQSLAFIDDRDAYSFLGLYHVGSDHIEWLVAGPEVVRNPRWSPDGRYLAYQRLAGRDHATTIDLGESISFAVETVDVKTHARRVIWESPGPATFPYFNSQTALRWTSGNELLFYSEHDGWGRLYVVSVQGDAAPKAVTPPGCEVSGSEFIEPQTVLVAHNCPNLETRHLSLFDLQSHRVRDLSGEDLVVTDPVRSQGRYVAYTGSTASDAPLVRVIDLSSGREILRERSTDLGYSPAFTTPPPQSVTFTAEDGTLVHAQLFRPASSGKHPAVVWFHGGPYAQSFPAFHHTRELARYFAINRQLAETGYVVLSVNYRGSQGYGLKFRQDPKRAWRGAAEVLDSAAAARWLANRPEVDPRRIGVWGGSYGGYMTAQSLARHSDLYAAGVALYGLYDWSFSSNNGGRWDPSRDFGVAPQDRPKTLQFSPAGALATWKSPVLLFTGDNDIYVDVAQTIELSQKLRAHDIPVQVTIIPDESHGFVMQRSVVRLWHELLAFFDQQLNQSR